MLIKLYATWIGRKLFCFQLGVGEIHVKSTSEELDGVQIAGQSEFNPVNHLGLNDTEVVVATMNSYCHTEVYRIKFDIESLRIK